MRVGTLTAARVLWGASLLTMLVAGCREDLTAPGSCPDYCPAKRIDVFDSLFVGSITADSAWTGYITPDQAARAQAVTDGAVAESHPIIRFLPLPDAISALPIASIDSFRLDILMPARAAVTGLELDVHRLPADIDSTTTYADLEPYFEDSTLIGVFALPDTLVGGVLSTLLPGDAFPTLAQDGWVAAVGFNISSGPEAWVDLATLESFGQAVLTMFARIVQGEDTTEVSDFRQSAFDSYVSVDQTPFDRDILGVGGAPSWRSILRVDLPSYVVDSSDVSRATLILVPSEPILGGAGDTLRLRADALTEDVGPKSPIVAPAPETRDTLSVGGLSLFVGAIDTVVIDVTHVIKPWRADTSRPHSIVLWMVPEATSVGQARFWSSRSAVGAPSLAITYVPLFPRNEP
jgi:hypothetical protein